MPRIQISIKLDSKLLAEVDQFAEDIGVTRTSIIEQCIKNELPRQAENYELLANPLVRTLHQKVTSPSVLRLLAKLTQSDMTDEEIEEIVNKGPHQREAAKKRATAKKHSMKNTEDAS